MPFNHYIITRFNIGLYSSNIDRDKWMRHRINLFANITLPSIMAQTCQNFTWLVLMDSSTPKEYRDLLNAVKYKNLKLIYLDGDWTNLKLIANTILNNIEPGNYDLITTRIDNDDAFNINAIEKIQYWYTPKPDRWMISFPYGVILNINTKEMNPVKYSFNHFPTLIESATDAKTVFFWNHYNIDVEVKESIYGSLYWLQTVHSQNIDNSDKERPSIVVIKDKPIKPDILTTFGLDPQKIMNMDFEASSNLDTTPA